MTNSKIILSCLITGILIMSCKKDDDETINNDASDAVCTYFAYLKATSGLNSSTKKSAKMNNNEPTGKLPDFFLNPYRLIDPDSANIITSENRLDNGDYIYTRDFGKEYQLCVYTIWSDKSDHRVPYYYHYYLKGYINDYGYNYNLGDKQSKSTEIINIQVKYPDDEKEYTIEGSITSIDVIDDNWDDETDNNYTVRDMKLKIGAIGNEIDYTENQKSRYGNFGGHKTTIVDEGTSKHSGKKGVYNTTITSALQQNQDSRNIIIGTAKITYTMNGKSGEFLINYGSGDDDSMVSITENEKTYEVDYITLQKEMTDSINK